MFAQLKYIGNGSFGKVYKAIWKKDLVAVKHLIKTDRNAESFKKEVKILEDAVMNHPNLAIHYGSSSGDPCFLVMEYSEMGSLHYLLHLNTNLHYTMDNALNWAEQCARGAAYLHSVNMVHRDLKPHNMLLFSGGVYLKICDFGTARLIESKMTTHTGTPRYMAPEVFESGNYKETCDVFSWAISLWEILSRKVAFEEYKDNWQAIQWKVYHGMRPPNIRGCPSPIKELIERCWHKDPNERHSMKDIVKYLESLRYFFPGCNSPLIYNNHFENKK